MSDQSRPCIKLPSRLTIELASSVLAELQASLARMEDSCVALDAAGLRDFDTSAVAVLLELRRLQVTRGRELDIVNWPDRLISLVRLYGVDGLLRVSPTATA